MTKRLILVRHAKSGWDDPTLDDHSRPLSARGVRASGAIGKWLKDNHFMPDMLLSSTAERTRETWELIQNETSFDPKVQFSKEIYLASPDVMLNSLRKVEDAETVMLLCHNPGAALLAAGLVKSPPNHPQFDRYPTAATTVIEFQLDDWSELSWGTGTVLDFVVPRDLEPSN